MHDDRYYTETEVTTKLGQICIIRDVGLVAQTIGSPGYTVFQIESYYSDITGYTLISSQVISASGAFCTYMIFGQIFWWGMNKIFLPMYNPLSGSPVSISPTVRFTFIKNEYKVVSNV